MTKIMRSQGFESAIWKLLDREAPDHCPECNCKNSLTYIGYAQNYNHLLQAKLYVCHQCDAWLDVVWPKATGTIQAMDINTKKLATVAV